VFEIIGTDAKRYAENINVRATENG